MNARVLLLLFAGACSGSTACGSSASTPEGPGAVETTGATSEEGPAIAPPEAMPNDPAPVPVVTLPGESSDEGLTMRILVTGADAVQLARGAQVERLEGETWQPLEGDFALRDSCQDTSDECVTLTPGAEFIPPPWTGAQCGDETSTLEPGTYRLVVSSCAPEGHVPHRVTGSAVIVP